MKSGEMKPRSKAPPLASLPVIFGSGAASGIGRSHRKGPASPEHRSRPDVVHLDPVIHEHTRLSILTALFTAGQEGCSFSDLRDTLSLTDGNLMAHLRTLEMAELVERVKEGAGRNSSTTVQLSHGGKKAFKNYLDQLETLVRAARGK